MESAASEFSRFWLPLPRDDEARRQQKALEELAVRVSAARMIV